MKKNIFQPQVVEKKFKKRVNLTIHRKSEIDMRAFVKENRIVTNFGGIFQGQFPEAGIPSLFYLSILL